MSQTDSGERSEQATPKRMKEVRSKGQLSRSQDLTAWVGVGAACAMMPATIDAGSRIGADQFFSLGAVAASPDPLAAVQVMVEGMQSVMTILGPLLAVVLVAVLGTAAVQGGIHLKKFKGKFEQFHLWNGMKRVFGTQALWEGVKALLKTAVVGGVLYWVVQSMLPVLMTAGGLSVSTMLAGAADGVALLLQAAVIAGLGLAAADLFVVMKRNRKRTMMTKKEVRDENKNSEGDPLIRSQRRARQLAMSRNRMIASVAGSDVVLVNPTHFAVALSYEPGRSAPRVVAKGAGLLAARIREQAEQDGVPIVRDVPLARALHTVCELGDEIPVELYDAVARVLAFVLALKRRGSAGGVHTLTEPTIGGDYVATRTRGRRRHAQTANSPDHERAALEPAGGRQ